MANHNVQEFHLRLDNTKNQNSQLAIVSFQKVQIGLCFGFQDEIWVLYWLIVAFDAEAVLVEAPEFGESFKITFLVSFQE